MFLLAAQADVRAGRRRADDERHRRGAETGRRDPRNGAEQVRQGARGRCIPPVQATGKPASLYPLPGLFAQSSRGGGYTVHALFPNKYVVYFELGCGNRGNYAPQWWRDSATRGHATPIRIKSGLVVGHVDAALPPGATVSGVVKAFSGKPLSGICVFASSPTAPFAERDDSKERQLQAHRHGHGQLPDLLSALPQPRELPSADPVAEGQDGPGNHPFQRAPATGCDRLRQSDR